MIHRFSFCRGIWVLGYVLAQLDLSNTIGCKIPQALFKASGMPLCKTTACLIYVSFHSGSYSTELWLLQNFGVCRVNPWVKPNSLQLHNYGFYLHLGSMTWGEYVFKVRWMHLPGTLLGIDHLWVYVNLCYNSFMLSTCSPTDCLCQAAEMKGWVQSMDWTTRLTQTAKKKLLVQFRTEAKHTYSFCYFANNAP